MTTQQRRTVGVWTLTAALAATATAVWAIALRTQLATTTKHTDVPWFLVAALFYLAEANVVHLYFRGDAHTFSLSEVPLVVGLVFLTPSALVLAAGVGSGLAFGAVRRQRPVKLVFNVSQVALGAALAALTFRALAPGGNPAPDAWP